MAGRPRASITIVDKILTLTEIHLENTSIFSLFTEFNDDFSVLQYAAWHRSVANNVKCSICNMPSTLNKYSQNQDGWRWRCNANNFSQAVRHRLFFERSHLPLKIVILLLYMWCFDFTQVLITRELRLVIDWCNFLREVCEQYLEENPQQHGGLDENGEPIVVEIDKSKYFHRKYHRCQWRQGHWVFWGHRETFGSLLSCRGA